MSVYYKKIETTEHSQLIQVLRDGFGTVAKDLSIEENVFRGFGAYYTQSHLAYDLNHGCHFIGAYNTEDKALVGCIAFSYKDKGVGKLSKLAVVPAFRHLSIGRTLMKEAMIRLLSLGVMKVELGLITENVKLLEWYKLLGFVTYKTMSYKNSGFHVTLMNLSVSHFYELYDAFGIDYIGCDVELSDSIVENLNNVKNSNKNNQIGLLYSADELNKGTNTGMLAQRLWSAHVSECLYKRDEAWLLEAYLQRFHESGYEIRLMFPDGDNGFDTMAEENECNGMDIDLDGTTVKYLYLIIDATWQEANQMVNRSEPLKALKRYSLSVAYNSVFALRRNQRESGLCTVETAQALMYNGSTDEKCKMVDKLIKKYIG